MQGEHQFSNNKLFFYADRLKTSLSGRVANPIVYELSLSGFCNCSCEYCCCQNYHSNNMLLQQDIDIIVTQLKSVDAKAVTLTGGGEPLTNPLFSYCVKKLNENDLRVGVITNGILLNDEAIKNIVKCASFVRISLDTVDKDAYKSIRGIDIELDKMFNNLKALAKYKKKVKSEILIGCQIVYFNQSISDVKKTVNFVKKSGIDFIQIRPVDNIPQEDLKRNYDFYIKNRAGLKKLVNKYSDNNFSVILNDNKFEEYYNSSVTKEYSKCLGANFTASIGHDMNLYFCCSHIGNLTFSVGNLRERSLIELLADSKRKSLIENPCFSYCQTQCRNHNINKILNDLSKMDAEQLDILINEKNREPQPIHCDFL